MSSKKLASLIKNVCFNKIVYILEFSIIGTLIGLPANSFEFPKLCESKLSSNQSGSYRAENTDLLTTLEEEDEFINLTYEIKQTQLSEKITQMNEKYIILAPNDSAFIALSEDEYTKYFDSSNKENVLKYHIIDSKNDQESSKGELKTLEGSNLLFSRNNGQLTIDTANAKYPCISTTNGIIIEIDRILVPDELSN